MSILAYNGGAIIAMTGKNCVAIASDTRLGLQQQTVSCDFQKVGKYVAFGSNFLKRFFSHIDLSV